MTYSTSDQFQKIIDEVLEKYKDDILSLEKSFADVLVREAYEAGVKAAEKKQEKKESLPSASDFTNENIDALRIKSFSSENCILIGQKQLIQFHELHKDYANKFWRAHVKYSRLETLIKALNGETKEYITFMGLKVILTELPDLLVVGCSAKF